MGWNDDNIAYNGPTHSYSWDQQQLNTADNIAYYHYDSNVVDSQDRTSSPLLESQPPTDVPNDRSSGCGAVQAFAETLNRLTASLEEDVELESVIRQAKQQLQAISSRDYIDRPEQQQPPFEYLSEATAGDYTHHRDAAAAAAVDSHYPFQSRNTLDDAVASVSAQERTPTRARLFPDLVVDDDALSRLPRHHHHHQTVSATTPEPPTPVKTPLRTMNRAAAPEARNRAATTAASPTVWDYRNGDRPYTSASPRRPTDRSLNANHVYRNDDSNMRHPSLEIPSASWQRQQQQPPHSTWHTTSTVGETTDAAAAVAPPPPSTTTASAGGGRGAQQLYNNEATSATTLHQLTNAVQELQQTVRRQETRIQSLELENERLWQSLPPLSTRLSSLDGSRHGRLRPIADEVGPPPLGSPGARFVAELAQVMDIPAENYAPLVRIMDLQLDRLVLEDRRRRRSLSAQQHPR
jgi:hypothetical protein